MKYLIMLDKVGTRKIQIIKYIRRWTSISLKEAKNICDGVQNFGVPTLVAECDNIATARSYVQELVNVGAEAFITDEDGNEIVLAEPIKRPSRTENRDDAPEIAQVLTIVQALQRDLEEVRKEIRELTAQLQYI